MKIGLIVSVSALLVVGNAFAAKQYEAGGQFNNCIQEGPGKYGGRTIRNNCSEHLYITWRDPNAGMEAMDLQPGRSWDLNNRPVGGLAVCRFGFSPVDANDRNWSGSGQFRCMRY